MKLNNIISTQTIRFLKASVPSGTIYMPDFTALMQKKFRFIQVPTTLEEYDASKGVKFYHGTYKGIGIDALQIYDNGVSVLTKTNSKEGDKIIDALIEMASKELGVSVIEIPHLEKNYISDVEIVLEKDIGEAFERFTSAYKLLNKFLAKQAHEVPPFRVSGILLHCDLNDSPYLKPGRFVLERRGILPYNQNTYYSSAPLPTDAHLEVLQEIEKAL